MAEAYRTFAKKHPGRYAASVAAPTPGDTEYELAAAQLLRTVSAVLAQYQLVGDDEIHAIRGLRALMHGFVSLQVAGGFALSQDLDESYHRMVAGFARSLERTAEDAAVPVSPSR